IVTRRNKSTHQRIGSVKCCSRSRKVNRKSRTRTTCASKTEIVDHDKIAIAGVSVYLLQKILGVGTSNYTCKRGSCVKSYDTVVPDSRPVVVELTADHVVLSKRITRLAGYIYDRKIVVISAVKRSNGEHDNASGVHIEAHPHRIILAAGARSIREI